jgi:outer membrane protein assembly factor BamD
MRAIRVSLTFIAFIVIATSCSQYGKVLKSKDPNYQLKKADEYFAKKRYKAAQPIYEELFSLVRGTTSYEDVYYKDAYCYFAMKMYHEAENLFKGFLEVFPNSTRSEEVDYLRAYCFYKQSPKVELEQVNTAKAIGQMQTFINTHPGSPRIKDANEIIIKSREKLELKDYRAAELYYNLGQYRASALGFEALINSYPESVKGEDYKLKSVRSYYKFAKMSIPEKQIERFQTVISQYEDFVDRYPDSKLLKEAESYKGLSLNHIKDLQHEQTQTSAKR